MEHCTACECHGSQDHTAADQGRLDRLCIVELALTASEVYMLQIAALVAVGIASEVVESAHCHQTDIHQMIPDLVSCKASCELD